ncbi:MAG: MBL fold metallo-hydrolase [Gammaproteobacteria bacterium]
MLQGRWKLSAWIILSSLCAGQAWAGSGTDRAHDEVQAAIQALGGEDVLKSVHSIQYSAVGHRNMLEQSLRPDGPWWQDYFQETVTLDFQDQRVRMNSLDRGYASSHWWLKHDSWDGAGTDVVYDDGVVAAVTGGKFSPISNYYLQYAQDDLAFDPGQLLLAAAASPDLHAEADRQFHGYTHHVVSWTQNGVPVHLLLNGYTALPEEVEWTQARPYDVFWNVWGDVKSRIDFGMWALEPEGLRYPRQLTIERNGLPDSDVSITSVTVNRGLDDLRLTIPDDVKKQALAHKHFIDDVALGFGGGPATELEPGVVHIPAGWNVNLIRQSDGILVLEGPVSSDYSAKVLAEVARRYPGEPVKGVITTSDSWPHIGGLREYAARGIPIYAPDLNKEVLDRLFAAPHTERPDALQQHPRKAIMKYIAARTSVGSGANRVELIPYRSETGERQMLVYFPEYKLLYTSDLFAPDTATTWFTPEYLLELQQTIAREHLAVENVFGMHYDLTPMKTLDDAQKAYLGK